MPQVSAVSTPYRAGASCHLRVPEGRITVLDPDTLGRLRIVFAKTARELNRTSTLRGLTPTQASVLGMVYSRGPLAIAELIELENLHPSTLSRAVGRLTQLGFTTRSPDATDQRAIQVAVTPEGRRTAHHLRAARTQALAECIEGLPGPEVDSIVAALDGLEHLAEALRTVE